MSANNPLSVHGDTNETARAVRARDRAARNKDAADGHRDATRKGGTTSQKPTRPKTNKSKKSSSTTRPGGAGAEVLFSLTSDDSSGDDEVIGDVEEVPLYILVTIDMVKKSETAKDAKKSLDELIEARRVERRTEANVDASAAVFAVDIQMQLEARRLTKNERMEEGWKSWTAEKKHEETKRRLQGMIIAAVAAEATETDKAALQADKAALEMSETDKTALQAALEMSEAALEEAEADKQAALNAAVAMSEANKIALEAALTTRISKVTKPGGYFESSICSALFAWRLVHLVIVDIT
jgi:hypothetical protein